MRYRRAWNAGGTFFFTVNLEDRRSDRLTANIDTLRRSFQHVVSRYPFRIDAIVILPDHLHAIWTLPENDHDFPTRWALIKAGFSRSLPFTEDVSNSRRKKGERGLWQRRYWEHRIRDDDDLKRHVDYIHWNPVKHGHVNHAVEWPYSSIHRYVRDGVIAADWGGEPGESSGGFGERS